MTATSNTISVPAYSRKEEAANTWSHLIGAVLGIAALITMLLTVIVQGDPWRIVSVIIYGSSLFILFLASSLYHYAVSPTTKGKLKTFDHCAIFLLIAGTYTPYLLIELKGVTGWSMFAVIWTLAAIGITSKIYWAKKFKKISLFFYLLMGWLIVFTGDDLLNTLKSGALYWLIAGGLTYSIGAFFYANKRIPYNHAIWHVFVLFGSICHFISIYNYVLPVE